MIDSLAPPDPAPAPAQTATVYQRIVTAFNERPEKVFRVRDLHEYLGLPTDEPSVNVTRSRLGRLVRQGLLEQPGRGRYRKQTQRPLDIPDAVLCRWHRPADHGGERRSKDADADRVSQIAAALGGAARETQARGCRTPPAVHLRPAPRPDAADIPVGRCVGYPTEVLFTEAVTGPSLLDLITKDLTPGRRPPSTGRVRGPQARSA